MEGRDQKLITDQEILDLALKIEREGQAFYERLGRHIKDPTVKNFVQQMHKEEIQHETDDPCSHCVQPIGGIKPRLGTTAK